MVIQMHKHKVKVHICTHSHVSVLTFYKCVEGYTDVE